MKFEPFIGVEDAVHSRSWDLEGVLTPCHVCVCVYACVYICVNGYRGGCVHAGLRLLVAYNNSMVSLWRLESNVARLATAGFLRLNKDLERHHQVRSNRIVCCCLMTTTR